MSKKVGIIGSGAVAKSLAKGFLSNGYEVMLGSRDINKLKEWQNKQAENVKLGTFEEAVNFGELVVLATKGSASESLVKSLSQSLSGKAVIDTTNPIADAPPKNGVIQVFTSANESLMERLQKAVPTANFVKAFNSVGNSYMVNPKLPGGKPTMFIAGNNDAAKAQVKEILDLFGWETEDLGKAEAAGPIEQLCVLWCIPGFLRNQWAHAFKLLKA